MAPLFKNFPNATLTPWGSIDLRLTTEQKATYKIMGLRSKFKREETAKKEDILFFVLIYAPVSAVIGASAGFMSVFA
jgi:hypothetical protein